MSDANILTIKITDDPSNSSPSNGGSFKPSPPEPIIATLTPEDRQLQQEMKQRHRVIMGLANQREQEEKKEIAQREKERVEGIAEYKRGQKVLDSLRRQREAEEKKLADAVAAETKERLQQARDASQSRTEMYEGIQSAMALSQSGFKSATSMAGMFQQIAGSGLFDGNGQPLFGKKEIIAKHNTEPQVPKQKADPSEIIARIPQANVKIPSSQVAAKGAQAAGGGVAAAGEGAAAAAGGAAAGSGAAAAMGAAGGPIMLIAMAADKAADEMVASMDRYREGIEMMGDTARKVASDDVYGVLDSNVDRASKAIEQIPIYGKIYAAEMQLAAAPFREIKATLDTFIERGRELSGYDGRTAAAYAQADVMKLQSDIKEAQTMGAQYAALAMKQAEADRAIKEALLPIKMQIAELAVTVMPTVVNLLQSIALILAETGNVGEGVLRSYPGMGFLIDKTKEINKMTKDLQQMEQNDVFENWLKEVRDMPLNEPANADDMGQFKRDVAGPMKWQ